MTFEDLLKRTMTDLRHWKEIIEADPSIGDACPEHTEELELEIRALEIAIEKDDYCLPEYETHWQEVTDKTERNGG